MGNEVGMTSTLINFFNKIPSDHTASTRTSYNCLEYSKLLEREDSWCGAIVFKLRLEGSMVFLQKIGQMTN